MIKFMRQIIFFFLVTLLGVFPSLALEKHMIIGVGDSLMAGYGLPPQAGFVPQLQQALRAKGYAVDVVNAGVSGDTTSGGRSRLEWSVPAQADMVILELGANDALRGVPPAVTRENLDFMLTQLKQKNIKILLVGMLAPPNMGEAYSAAFNPIYPALAKKHNVILYPFFLEGVAANPALNLDDGIHPNKKGVAVMVKNILPNVEQVLNTHK